MDDGGCDLPVEWRADALQRLAGIKCTGGLDLSTTTDVTAFVLVFQQGGKTTLLPWFWLPEVNAQQRERRDRGAIA